MNGLLADAAGYLKERGQGVLQRLRAQAPFLALVMASIALAVAWGLHETHLLLVRSGVAEPGRSKPAEGLAAPVLAPSPT